MVLQYDREELYRQVWDQPMLKVAEAYGVSSVALGKTCRKLHVPVPGRGYWAKLAHGHEVTGKPLLPKLDKVPVIYRAPLAEKKSTSDQSDAEFEAIDQRLASGAFAPSQVDMATPHSLIRATASRLRSKNRVNEFGILVPREPGGLDVTVSEGTLDRALQVMAQVIAVLERQGYSVGVSDEGRSFALIDGRQIPFAIEEPIRKVVTQKARVPNPTDRWDYDEIVTHEPAGKLVLTVLAATWGQFEQRKRWSDAKVKRLENLIPDVIAGLIRTAVSLRKQEEDRIRREADEQRRTREREQLRKDIKEEEEKLEEFQKRIESWDQADRMRRFIAAYEEKSRSWPAEKQKQYKAWVEWAHRQADRIDPLVPKKSASVLDRKHELIWW
jgi:hypothetical protein